MVKMCSLKPKSDLFLRFVLYLFWLWVVNLENFTPSLSGPFLKLASHFQAQSSSQPPTPTHTHTHTHIPTVWFTPTVCTPHLPGISYVAKNNSFTHTQRYDVLMCFNGTFLC